MLVMKHERMKFLTFRTKKWMEELNEVLKWRPATSKNRELEMARAGVGRRRVFSLGPIVSVCSSNPDYRWTSISGWIHQPGLEDDL